MDAGLSNEQTISLQSNGKMFNDIKLSDVRNIVRPGIGLIRDAPTSSKDTQPQSPYHTFEIKTDQGLLNKYKSSGAKNMKGRGAKILYFSMTINRGTFEHQMKKAYTFLQIPLPVEIHIKSTNSAKWCSTDWAWEHLHHLHPDMMLAAMPQGTRLVIQPRTDGLQYCWVMGRGEQGAGQDQQFEQKRQELVEQMFDGEEPQIENIREMEKLKKIKRREAKRANEKMQRMQSELRKSHMHSGGSDVFVQIKALERERMKEMKAEGVRNAAHAALDERDRRSYVPEVSMRRLTEAYIDDRPEGKQDLEHEYTRLKMRRWEQDGRLVDEESGEGSVVRKVGRAGEETDPPADAMTAQMYSANTESDNPPASEKSLHDMIAERQLELRKQEGRILDAKSSREGSVVRKVSDGKWPYTPPVLEQDAWKAQRGFHKVNLVSNPSHVLEPDPEKRGKGWRDLEVGAKLIQRLKEEHVLEADPQKRTKGWIELKFGSTKDSDRDK